MLEIQFFLQQILHIADMVNDYQYMKSDTNSEPR